MYITIVCDGIFTVTAATPPPPPFPLISQFKHRQTSVTSQHILLSILLYISIHNLSFSRLCAHAFCSIIPLTGALYSSILYQNQTDIQMLHNPELV